MCIFAVIYFDVKHLMAFLFFSAGIHFFLLLSPVVPILVSKAALLGKDDPFEDLFLHSF